MAADANVEIQDDFAISSGRSIGISVLRRAILRALNARFAGDERPHFMSLVTQAVYSALGDPATLKKVHDQYHECDHEENVD